MFVRGSDFIKLYRSLPKKEREIIFFTLLIMTTYLHISRSAKKIKVNKGMLIPVPKKNCYDEAEREFKECFMKLNYQERIDLTADELKIIGSQRREL